MTQVKGNTALKQSEENAKPVLQVSIPTKKESDEPTKAEATAETTQEKKIPTLQEIKERATLLALLNEKHSKLIDKRASLDNFRIKHESDRAEIIVTDAEGEEFRSSSPKTVGKLIEFWKEEFSEAIASVEAEMKLNFGL